MSYSSKLFLKIQDFNDIIYNMIKSSIFKSYDIRGIYPNQLNENTAYQIGRGFVKHAGAKKIFVGHDARFSSLELFRAFAEGAISQGADIYNIGLVPTEAVYFAVGAYDCDAGIMITASHNPKKYNGFKMMTKEGDDIVWIRGRDLFSTIEKNSYEEKPHGKIYEQDIWKDYAGKVLSFVGDKIEPFKIAVDASNGVAGIAILKIKGKLPIEITELNFEPNGNFPNHPPNPMEDGSLNQIKDKIVKNGLDFGFIFDGDGDRIFLVDETGKMVSADIVLLILAKYFLLNASREAPRDLASGKSASGKSGETIAYNAVCSKAVPEFIKKWGGNPVRTAVGFVNIREGLIKNNGIMGGELSAHYCFRDYFYTDSGIIAFLTLLQIISSENKKVSELAKELSPYFKSSELNFEIEDKEAVLEKIKEKYLDGRQDFLDGVTVEYKDWWFNVRPSNTEPLLRLTVEANTEDLLEQKKKELNDFIKS